MEQFLQAQEKIPLPTKDILKIMQPERAIQVDFKDLVKSSSLLNAFKGHNIILLFYNIKGQSGVGHWCLLYKDAKVPTTLHFFDPYGGASPLSQHEDPVQKRAFSELVKKHKEKYKFEINKYQYQKWSKSVETCGRWCGLRGRMICLSPQEFKSFFKYRSATRDELVALMTAFIFCIFFPFRH